VVSITIPLSPQGNVGFPSIAIIMSAFNNEKYIQEQIDSILNQERVSIQLWIRDDGSTDRTLSIIRELYGQDDRITIKTGKNLGARESFFEALFTCDLQCDYIGFSDADDVWISNKIRHSIDLLSASSSDGPIAVATRVHVVDENLNHIGYTTGPKRGFSFSNALVETVATGATIVMNKSALSLIRSARPGYAVMHDAWIYLVITAFGKLIYSELPTSHYRQHAANVFGTSHTLRHKNKLRFRRLREVSPYRRQAHEFSRLFGSSLSNALRQTLENYLSYPKNFMGRIKFAIFPDVVKQNAGADVFMRLLILLGKE
jgi:glycosyltransferase involved in cell wall biosynthesis